MPVKDLIVSRSSESKKGKSQENTGPTHRNSAAPNDRPQKVGFISLGCPKNLVDSEVMMGMLARAGAELTRRAEDADVIVVNTCSFINSAQQESVNTILEMAAHKTSGKAKKLVVAGCLVERYRDQIRKDIPEVDAVVGTGELMQILAATGIAPAPAPTNSPFVVLNSRPEGDARAAQGRFSRESWDGAIGDLPNYLYDEDTPRILATPQHMAIYQDRRRLRSSLYVLYHPAIAGAVSFAAIRIGHCRGRAVGAIRCSRSHAHRARHHLLWRGFWAERRIGASAGETRRH